MCYMLWKYAIRRRFTFNWIILSVTPDTLCLDETQLHNTSLFNGDNVRYFLYDKSVTYLTVYIYFDVGIQATSHTEHRYTKTTAIRRL